VRRSTLAMQFSGVALTAGLVISGIATAAPVGANETMKAELHRLRVCESGNNYHENTGNGYYGAYQFSPTTWSGLGFHGRPDKARPVRQDHAAKRLHARSGWGAWPACSRTAHLR
jgi:resuscitation-promoting factor RpfA